MSLETDIFTAFWDGMLKYRDTTLGYIRGWFQADMENIPAGSLPALCVFPTAVDISAREGRADRFLLALTVKGHTQHFNPIESATGIVGRTGILDLYHDIDRAIFTMLTQEEVTVNTVTTTVQTFPIFTDAEEVRDIIIGSAEFNTEIYETVYPNLTVTIPVQLWYIKKDTIRRIE